MNLKVPGAILPLGCAILSTRAKTVRGGWYNPPPLGELGLTKWPVRLSLIVSWSRNGYYGDRNLQNKIRLLMCEYMDICAPNKMPRCLTVVASLITLSPIVRTTDDGSIWNPWEGSEMRNSFYVGLSFNMFGDFQLLKFIMLCSNWQSVSWHIIQRFGFTEKTHQAEGGIIVNYLTAWKNACFEGKQLYIERNGSEPISSAKVE